MTNSSSELPTNDLITINQETLSKKKENLRAEVQNFRNQRVTKLRVINHWWNISLTVAGITFTMLTAVLGVVENNTFKDLLKFGIGLSGAIAVAAQSANREFQVRGKAGEYTLVEAEMMILEHQIPNAKSESELENLQNSYYDLLRRTAEAEAHLGQED